MPWNKEYLKILKKKSVWEFYFPKVVSKLTLDRLKYRYQIFLELRLPKEKHKFSSFNSSRNVIALEI